MYVAVLSIKQKNAYAFHHFLNGISSKKKGEFIMDNKLLYLSQADVKSVGLTMAEIIQATEKGFVEMGNGQVEMPPNRYPSRRRWR